MAFSLDNSGTLTTTEARERALTGYVANTVDLSHQLDTTENIDDTIAIGFFLDSLGIHFTSTDTTISIFDDGSIEAQEFIEGTRVYLTNDARLNVVFLIEEI